MVILPFGERAVLVEVADLREVLSLHRRLESSRPEGVLDLVPAARTVLVRVDPAVLSLSAARSWIEGEDAAPLSPSGDRSRTVEIPIVYDGADLDAAASALGMSVTALVERHAQANWTVAFTGFAPGFGYLVSEEWPYDVPRLESPRTRVPAGAVGLAGEFTGAYPRETPGGWQLIGSTTAVLFDPAASRPALLQPGDRVRFAPARPSASGTAATGAAENPAPPKQEPAARPERPAAEIVEPGPLTTVQDQGRPGHLAAGIAISGAADRGALRTANRLVGNDEGAAGLEITLGGLRLTARRDLWVAVTGAWGPLSVDGRAVPGRSAVRVPAGAEFAVSAFTAGVRGYLAIRGGIDAPALLGSAATDVLSGLGPARLLAGDVVRIGDRVAGPVPPEDLHPWTAPADVIEVPVAPGPRADWFTEHARAVLFDAVWTVSSDADRVGIRLDGPELARRVGGEVPSEAMLPGALQVPPLGRPVVLGPDGPVTGGYPVIGVVADVGRDLLAQARPGTRIRMRHARPHPR
ncbi:KipI family sensor histidine kinase inhibitor [Microbacterium marinum]|uniref:KipI family sensor histidine kinase inhibitor n=1 Tax=Microbacterium marinum TaxID=421115 RepID=A0A7W7BNR7_9MICO|nr:KipI family sensor histidine kinase inhibitor [Microbacterium marinum]